MNWGARRWNTSPNMPEMAKKAAMLLYFSLLDWRSMPAAARGATAKIQPRLLEKLSALMSAMYMSKTPIPAMDAPTRSDTFIREGGVRAMEWST